MRCGPREVDVLRIFMHARHDQECLVELRDWVAAVLGAGRNLAQVAQMRVSSWQHVYNSIWPDRVAASASQIFLSPRSSDVHQVVDYYYCVFLWSIVPVSVSEP